MSNKIDFSKFGYDYGLKPHLMLVADPEFSNLFREAKCIALQYFFTKDDKGLMIPAGLAFGFENEKPADGFFNILLEWIEKSNGNTDAVLMEFVETKEGGYVLGIAQDMVLFVDRMIPKSHKDKISPMTILATQFKEIPILGENYLTFKNNINKADNITISYAIVKGTEIIKQSDKSFTKKNFNFYEEDNIPQDSLMVSYYAAANKLSLRKKAPQEAPKPSESDLLQRRLSEMKIYLPLTCNRIKNKWLEEKIKRLEENYENTQIIQAICNLTIFERIKSDEEVLRNFRDTGHAIDILDYLLSTFESFESYYPSDDFYTQERIIGQIENDKNELEKHFNKP
ncbi:hypothetical protein ABXT06_21120 [Flavobacterium sp. UW10123]|uniref:hypothetical protein n=1 Tax=Flavobacterium sp. UW10123 TaxID=3230800 RepID=UPI003396109F